MAFNWLRRLAGIPIVQDEQETVADLFRNDIGPTNPKYLKGLMRSWRMTGIHTKKLTPFRVRRMREFLLHLREEQREVVYAHGWNKGVRV